MVYRFGELTLDATELTLRAQGNLVRLPPKSLQTLLVLVERSGHVVGKTELMDVLWPDGFVEESNLTQHIYLLRRALRRHGLADAIETLPRRGYSFRSNAPGSPVVTLSLSKAAYLRYAAAAASVAALLFGLR
jgi:DNA-binding winged helix-turn-helix (wHTH) protein